MVGRSFVRDELLSAAAADSAERRRPSSPGDSADHLYPAGGTKAAFANATAVAARRWQPPPLVANLEAPRKGSSVLVGVAGTLGRLVVDEAVPACRALAQQRSASVQQHTAAHLGTSSWADFIVHSGRGLASAPCLPAPAEAVAISQPQTFTLGAPKRSSVLTLCCCCARCCLHHCVVIVVLRCWACFMRQRQQPWSRTAAWHSTGTASAWQRCTSRWGVAGRGCAGQWCRALCQGYES